MNIIRTEDTCFGRPRIEDTRLEVYNIISELFYSESMDSVIEERNLSRDDLKQVIDYCRNMNCKLITKPYEKYCSNCILSAQHEGLDPDSIKLQKLDEDIYTDENSKLIVFGNKEELEEELYGKPGWIMAAQVYERWIE